MLIFINLLVPYKIALEKADLIYNHFNKFDGISSLPKDSAANIEAAAGKDRLLSKSELLSYRNQMNNMYYAFTVITSIFPLLGMFGTVCSLIPMVETAAATETQMFFGALTSTFWGIVGAVICKIFDIQLGSKVEDNEKHLEFLLNPKRTYNEEGD